jgi:CRP-like cAMP-binding protein
MMMVVTAVTVVIMLMLMLMTMIMTVIMRGMIVRRMIIAAMAVRVRFLGMRVRGGIGAAFGIERRLDLDDAGAEPGHHRLDDVVAADAQALRHNLGRQMAVAEMPGDPHQMERIGATDFNQRLGSGDHLDQAAVLQQPRSAMAFSRSSRNSSPRVPVIAIRRRCRSSKSRTTVSAAACVQRCWP